MVLELMKAGRVRWTGDGPRWGEEEGEKGGWGRGMEFGWIRLPVLGKEGEEDRQSDSIPSSVSPTDCRFLRQLVPHHRPHATHHDHSRSSA